MSTPLSAGARFRGAVLRAVFALPRPLRRLLAGRPVELDGQQLALEPQLLLRLLRGTGQDELWTGSVAASRAALEEGAQLVGSASVPVERLALTLPGPAGELAARLYTPESLPPGSALLLYFHGGGFVMGSLDTHDSLCAYLAHEARVRVLSVDYRLAPEHPFPAAVDDAFAAYDHIERMAESLGADPHAIAVGGDSSGANLAAVVAASPTRNPAFALLLFPRVEFTMRRRSHELFRTGFLLTVRSMENFERLYLRPEQQSDPRASVLLTDDLSGFPPTYLGIGGFDPLRDEGEAFATRLAEAGVPVELSRQQGLIHGYAAFFPLGGRFREGAADAAAALRKGVDRAVAPRKPGPRPQRLADRG